MQALADPATRTCLRPPAYVAYPILLDPCNQANVVADSSIRSLDSLKRVAGRDLVVMATTRVATQQSSAQQASPLGGDQAGGGQLGSRIRMQPQLQGNSSAQSQPGALHAKSDAEHGQPSVTLPGRIEFEFESPGCALRKVGEVLHRIPVYGGGFEVHIQALGLGAEGVGDSKWEPFFVTKLVVARVQEEQAAQLLAVLPKPEVRLMKFGMTPTYRDAATGVTRRKKKRAWAHSGHWLDDTFYLSTAAPGEQIRMRSSVHVFDNALKNMAAPPPYNRASSAEAVEALEAALKQHTFLVTGELKLSSMGDSRRIDWLL